jgi:histidinol dehydrogenase
MIRRVDLRGRALSKSAYRREIPRASLNIDQAIEEIAPVLDAVRFGDENVLQELSEKFDGVRPPSIRIKKSDLVQALASLNPEVRMALEEAIRRISLVHSEQSRSSTTTRVVDGGTVSQEWIPVDRVGLYVPGGRAVYPSSVLMNVIPAQIAGVTAIAVASPPQKEFGGLPHPTILAACALLGVEEVYAIGGAQAIAMFAYGVDGVCDSVDVVTGPGNIYVAAAKRALRGLIGIDSEAGPTEIAILADEFAIPSHVAADLISQAEHDTIAAAILVTDSQKLIEAVEIEIEKRVKKTKHKERIKEALSGVQSALVLVDSISQGADVVNAYAAEHLELLVENPQAVAKMIRNAGAVFLGSYSPVSLGDYAAGSNHVLPTGGCACHSSGLSVQTFLKGVSFISYDESALRDIAPNVITLSIAEDLPAHGEAISARFEGLDG